MTQIYIICEGHSEYAYIQKINQLLRDFEFDYYLVPKNAEGGGISKINAKLSELFRDNRKIKGQVWVWIDHDIYVRNPEEQAKLDKLFQENKRVNPQLVLNTQNFEDFLSLHFDEAMALDWMNICDQHQHFGDTPMHGCTYEPLFIEFLESNTDLPPYKKGKNALLSEMDWENALDNLKKNSANPTLKQRSDMSARILWLFGK